MAPSAHWILALVELIYFAPSALPLGYVLWSHRRTGLSGWTFLLLFIVLQCTGSGMIVSAGQNGTPSSIAIIIVQVGLSPLLLGLAGVVHEYSKLAGLATKERGQRLARIVVIAYHIAVVTAVAIYAVGASDSFKRPAPANAQSLYKVGVMLLLVLFLALCGAFVLIALRTTGTRAATPLFWSIAASLVLVAIRMIYSTVSAFNQDDPAFNPVTGHIAYQILLVFLPGALVIAATVTGGVMTTQVEVSTYGAVPAAAIPLTSSQRDSDASNV